MRSFRSDFNQIIEEFGFYQQLPPKFQNELTHVIFGKFMKKFSHILDECDQQFVNNMIVQLTYNFYEHGQVIQSAYADCEEIFLVSKGGIAICEPTCYSEPILVYGVGGIVNMYQILMDQDQMFKLVAVCQSYMNVQTYTGSILIDREDFQLGIFSR